MKATMEFNRASNKFEVWKAGQVLATYSNWSMAQYRVQFENEGM